MGEIYTQSRELSDWHISGKEYKFTAPQGYVIRQRGGVGLPDTQVTTSYRSSGRSNKVEDLKLADIYKPGLKTSFDNGHPFRTERRTTRLSHLSYDIKGTSGESHYQGPLTPFTGRSLEERWSGIPDIDLSVGADAIRGLSPGQPDASLLQMVSELVQSFPHVIGSIFQKQGITRSTVGEEYLNYVFGITPLVKDIEKILLAVVDSHKIISQYHRDAGRNVRRKRTFPTKTKHTVDKLIDVPAGLREPDYYFGGILDNGGSIGKTQMDKYLSETYSFSGAFTYYLPAREGFLGDLERWAEDANKLLGLRLTPALLWELTPWSWLADWFANIGTIVSNFSSLHSNGLVMRYGYLMRTSVLVTNYTTYGVRFNNGVSPGPVRATFRIVRKERVQATPYGFGLKEEEFNLQQMAILAALGMTQRPQSALKSFK